MSDGVWSTEADPPVRDFLTKGRVLMRVVSYGCEDCDLPDATGAWPDAWVALEEAHAHKEKNPSHRVHLLAEKVA